MDRKLIARYFIRETLGVVIMGVALLWPAGRVAWWPAWALLVVMAAWVAATATVILRTNPNLLAERLGPRQGAKSWDTIIMSVVGLLGLARLVLAGFDQRYGWSGDFSPVVQVAALALAALGYALGVWATASNAYFSQIVRVQSERGHAVATGGPYRYVRHPAYTGTIVFELAVPVLLASWYALIPGVLATVLWVIRTALEDRTLQAELEGYADYARQVRYRLLPGLW